MVNIFRRVLAYLFFTVISLSAFAQSSYEEKNDSVFVLVKQYFNQQNADAIYNLTGKNFRRNLTRDSLKSILNNQLFTLGAIKVSSFINFNNNISRYKLQFDSMNLQMLLSLDKESKIDLFLFQPYKEAAGNKMELAATSNPLKSAMDRNVDTVARTYIQKGNTIGLSIGIIRNGAMHLYNYGETELDNNKLPTENTIYEIGSITKTFTSTMLAWYVNAGKLNLNDPITKYLPDSVASNKALQAITLLQLSNHTSGLPRLPDNFSVFLTDPANPYKNYDRSLLYSYLKHYKVEVPPGTQYAYSNLAVGLLGVILENVSGKPFGQMVNEIISQTLGMSSTIQHLSAPLKSRMATLYNEEGKSTPTWTFKALAACGALKSTVNDLLVYAKANMNGSLNPHLNNAIALTHKITYDQNNITIALAWHIINVNGTKYYFHNGSTYGAASFMAFNPDTKLAVVVLSNAGVSTDELGYNLLSKLQ